MLDVRPGLGNYGAIHRGAVNGFTVFAGARVYGTPMHSASAINRGSASATAEPLVDTTVLRRIAEVVAAALRLRAQIEPLSPRRQREVALAWLRDSED